MSKTQSLKQHTLSSFLLKARQHFSLKNKATYWFGAVLSQLQSLPESIIPQDNIATNDKIQLICILSHSLAAIAGFYQKQVPETVFKLLSFVRNVIEGDEGCDHSFITAKVNYLNILAVYSIKMRQYSYAKQVLESILETYNNNVTDTANEVFLIAISNYLSMLHKTNANKNQIEELEIALKRIFAKYITCLLLPENEILLSSQHQSIAALTAIYKQNQELLRNSFSQELTLLLKHYYSNSITKGRRKLPQKLILFTFNQNIPRGISFGFKVYSQELSFYCSKNPRRVVKKYQQEQTTRIGGLEKLMQNSIELLTEQKLSSARYATLEQSYLKKLSDSFQTMQANQIITAKKFASIELSPIQGQKSSSPNKNRRRELFGKEQKSSKPRAQKAIKYKTITFKIHSLFIEVNQDGILLSDYTKQNKRYIEWNSICLIMERIPLQFAMEQFIKVPVETYYDFIRILIMHLAKNEDREVCLVAKPIPMLEVNEILKIYRQDGNFVKMALMNQYDTQRFIGVVDVYISEFDQFFKSVCENEYINYLNNRFLFQNSFSDKEDSIYYLDFFKKKRMTSSEQIQNQINVDHLERVIEQRNLIYKSVVLLKNNVKLFFKIIDNLKGDENPNQAFIQVKIQNMEFESFYLASQTQIQKGKKKTEKINKVSVFPLRQILKYIPLYDKSIKDYLSFHGRFILDCFNEFEHSLSEINLGNLSFEVMTYASKTEMIEYGKYFSPISAELIGSRNRVWALVLRYYDMAYLDYKITVLLNPYSDFLKQVTKINKEEGNEVLKNLLLNYSVKDTYKELKRLNRLNKIGSLMELVNLNTNTK